MRQGCRDGGRLGQGVLTRSGAGTAGGTAGTGVLLAEAGLGRDATGRVRSSGVLLDDLARAVGTPAFVYNADVIRARYAEFSAAFGAAGLPLRIHYAVKANGNLAVLHLLRRLGAGADIVSAGELARCLAAGYQPGDIVFSGVGKTPEELRLAVASELGAIHVESREELELLGRIAGESGQEVRVGIRFNPDVLTDTHPYISTGQSGAKFGVPLDQAADVLRILGEHPRLRLVTLAIHVGSQLLDIGPKLEGTRRLLAVLDRYRQAGVKTVEALDLGGGLGIRYHDEDPPAPADLAAGLGPVVAATGLRLQLEPGRFLVGSAGVLLTRVLYRKRAGGKTFVVVDAGMTELARPSRYGAVHEVIATGPPAGPLEPCDVVGPVCETGDFLALHRELPPVGQGDLLAVLGAGAYGFVMSSSYNARPRPPEVLVDGDRWAVARRRETVEHLMDGETADPFDGEDRGGEVTK